MKKILSLDVAKKTGVCFIEGNKLTSFTITSNDVYALCSQIEDVIADYGVKGPENYVVVEEHIAYNARNIFTLVPQLMRLGYIWHTIKVDSNYYNYNAQLISPNVVRSQFNIKGIRKTKTTKGIPVKRVVRDAIRDHTDIKFNDDETDAILMALYMMKETDVTCLSKYQVSRNKTIKV